MRTLPIIVMVVAVTLSVLGASPRAQAQDTTRVSVGFGGGTQGDGTNLRPAISADGRFVAFDSGATNLVAGDTNGRRDIFVHDRTTGQTTRVSVSSGGIQGNGDSFGPTLSADGRFVAFESTATNLVPGDTNASTDVFVRDRTTGQTSRVSVSSAGLQGNNSSRDAAISADGQIVAFVSSATNLVAGDTNARIDVFVRDRTAGATTRVSVGFGGGTQGNNNSLFPDISADGRFVAFHSSATNLVAGDTNGRGDIFVHDRQTGTTTRVSVGFAGGAQGDNNSFNAALSADGRFVVFQSHSTNLVAGDTNTQQDIFVHDRQTGATTRVSVGAGGGVQGNGGSIDPDVSADGRFVAFQSSATNLVPGDTNARPDVFLHDRTTGQTSRVSVAVAGGVQGNGNSVDPVLSADGRFVAFTSSASNLVPNDTNARSDIFVRDRGAAGGAGFSGAWQRLSQDCTGQGRAPRCKLKGTVTVTNPGTEKAQASVLRFYLSVDETLDPDDILLDEVRVEGLDAGERQNQPLSVLLDGDASALFVIAVLDATNEVAEVDEGNNIVVSPPIP